MSTVTPASRLAGLEDRLRQDLDWLKLPAKSWVKPRVSDGRRVHDVVVIGGGMCGMAATARLKLLGIDNVLTLDRAPQGFEGPWATYARMRTLRSPKDLAGPSLGLPALTYRAWHEARFGEESFKDLGKIDRLAWMDYLRWYRRVLGLDIRNGIALRRIRFVGDSLLQLDLEGSGPGDLPNAVLARRVVLATGRDNAAAAAIPDFVRGLDRRLWAHSTEDIDWRALAGRRIGIVGAGASTMDNAGHALENGVDSVDIFIRRADIPRINKFTGIESPGTTVGFVNLPDALKWRFLHHANTAQVPPPRESVLRVSQHAKARFHPSSPIDAVETDGRALTIRAAGASFDVDFLIVATGFVNDATLQPELAEFAPNILRWSDVFTPPAGEEHAEMIRSPYLGSGFEFREKTRGLTPGLDLIHCFSFAATLSQGKVSSDVPAVSEGADRMARWIARAFFCEDGEAHYDDLVAFDTPELLGGEWSPAPRPHPTGREPASALAGRREWTCP